MQFYFHFYASQRYNSDVTGSFLSVDMNVRYQMTAQDELSLKVSNLLNRSDFRATGSAVLPERNILLTYERSF